MPVRLVPFAARLNTFDLEVDGTHCWRAPASWWRAQTRDSLATLDPDDLGAPAQEVFAAIEKALPSDVAQVVGELCRAADLPTDNVYVHDLARLKTWVEGAVHSIRWEPLLRESLERVLRAVTGKTDVSTMVGEIGTPSFDGLVKLARYIDKRLNKHWLVGGMDGGWAQKGEGAADVAIRLLQASDSTDSDVASLRLRLREVCAAVLGIKASEVDADPDVEAVIADMWKAPRRAVPEALFGRLLADLGTEAARVLGITPTDLVYSADHKDDTVVARLRECISDSEMVRERGLQSIGPAAPWSERDEVLALMREAGAPAEVEVLPWLRGLLARLRETEATLAAVRAVAETDRLTHARARAELVDAMASRHADTVEKFKRLQSLVDRQGNTATAPPLKPHAGHVFVLLQKLTAIAGYTPLPGATINVHGVPGRGVWVRSEGLQHVPGMPAQLGRTFEFMSPTSARPVTCTWLGEFAEYGGVRLAPVYLPNEVPTFDPNVAPTAQLDHTKERESNHTASRGNNSESTASDLAETLRATRQDAAELETEVARLQAEVDASIECCKERDAWRAWALRGLPDMSDRTDEQLRCAWSDRAAAFAYRCLSQTTLRRRVERPDRRHPSTRGEGGQRIVWRGEHVMSRWCGGCPWCVLRARERLLLVLWVGVRRGLRVADDMGLPATVRE